MQKQKAEGYDADNGIIMAFLEKLGVTHALYLDMGNGWNHSWYRSNDGDVIEIHPKTHSFATNWIVFKK